MKQIYFFSQGDKMAYVAADNMNSAIYLLQDEKKGVPDFELDDTVEISVVNVLAIEKAAKDAPIKVYSKEFTTGKTVIFPVESAEDIVTSIANEKNQLEIKRVSLFTESAYLVK